MTKRQAGSTLIEAVISCFLLLMCFLIVINLFNSGLSYGPRIENQQVAAMVAERQLEQMRIWSSTLNGAVYNFDSPGLVAQYNGTSAPASDYSQITLSTNVTSTALYSPCSQLELGVVAAPPYVQPRKMDSCAQKVQVTASWDNGNRQIVLASLFARPALFYNPTTPITVSIESGGATTLAGGQAANFTAVGYDSAGNPINNLMFVWSVSPVNASGTITQARDGSVATLTNQIYVPPYATTPPYNGTMATSKGNLYVAATAQYHGVTMTANSTMITLTP